MHNCIIGTAGHVDHGKTALIEALTGHDTDRLDEEKRRHITIDLGYAPFTSDNPNDNIAIVDVPGHKDYLKNMLAGSCGIDFVLLTIACDEGVMPQTREHLEILDSLNAQDGIVVLTKDDVEIDAVQKTKIQAQIEDLVKNTFLQNSPRIEVSAKTGHNIDELKNLILTRIHDLPEKKLSTAEEFFLPIDRVFSVDGIGTIVTGSVMSGSCHVSDTLRLYPQDKEVRVRGMQNCGSDIQEAQASQRIAINLKNIEWSKISRGDVLSGGGNCLPSNKLLCKLKVFRHQTSEIKNNKRVFIHIGSRRIAGRIVLLDKNVISSGDCGYAMVVLETTYPLRFKDKFVFSDLTSGHSIGSGCILDTRPSKIRRFDNQVIFYLKELDQGLLSAVEISIRHSAHHFLTLEDLCRRLSSSKDEISNCLEDLVQENKVILLKSSYVSPELLEQLVRVCHSIADRYDNDSGVFCSKATLLQQMQQDYYLPDEDYNQWFEYAVQSNHLHVVNGKVSLENCSDNPIEESDDDSRILLAVELAGLKGCKISTLEEIGLSNINFHINELVKQGLIVRLDQFTIMSSILFDEAFYKFKQIYNPQTGVTLAEYKNALGLSRKPTQALLEAFDARNLTKRMGDSRFLK